MSIRKVVAGLLITAGIAIMAVPFFWRATGEKQTEQLISEFEQTLEDDYDEETDVEEEQTSISEEDEAILKEGGVIGIIEIPGLDIRYPVMEGTTSKVLNAGIGHIEETAGIGESGNCVLCGHNGSRYGTFFTPLSQISIGDEVMITDKKGQEHIYEVTETEVVNPYDNSIKTQGDEKELTLFTCSQKGTMKYSIKVNEVRAKEGSNIKGFATVVFGDSFKITNIAILENKDKGELFVSMPRYRSNERDESNGVIYKDVCNPITAEFREELYTNILDAYARIKEPEKEETQKQDRTQEMPEFSVTVTPYEREGSNIKGLARIYFENSFIVNNINIVQGKEKIFVSMPSYKTKQVDEQGKPIYQDVCYPVTKDFREKLYNEIISEYEKAKDKSNEKARESAEKHHGNPDKEKDKEATPFR